MRYVIYLVGPLRHSPPPCPPAVAHAVGSRTDQSVRSGPTGQPVRHPSQRVPREQGLPLDGPLRLGLRGRDGPPPWTPPSSPRVAGVTATATLPSPTCCVDSPAGSPPPPWRPSSQALNLRTSQGERGPAGLRTSYGRQTRERSVPWSFCSCPTTAQRPPHLSHSPPLASPPRARRGGLVGRLALHIAPPLFAVHRPPLPSLSPLRALPSPLPCEVHARCASRPLSLRDTLGCLRARVTARVCSWPALAGARDAAASSGADCGRRARGLARLTS